MTSKPLHAGAALRWLLAAAAALALLACGGGGAPRRASAAGRGTHGVDARACGTLTTDLGRRAQAFLQATIALETELASTDAALHTTCAVMARRLGLPGPRPRARRTGDTLSLCTAVAGALRARLGADPGAAAAPPPGSAPPVSTRASIQDPGQDPIKAPGSPPASAAAGPAGAAAGARAGAPIAAPAGVSAPPAAASPVTVRAAPATCDVHGDIAAQAAAACTAPAVVIALSPGADATRLAPVLRTLREDLPIVLRLRARLAGPLPAAMRQWGRAAADRVAAGPDALRPLGRQASCVFARIEAAAARLAAMQASLAGQRAAAAALEAAVRLQPD
jgi:hypothetical protein